MECTVEYSVPVLVHVEVDDAGRATVTRVVTIDEEVRCVGHVVEVSSGVPVEGAGSCCGSRGC
jgi:hypothetical protein